MMRWLSWVAGVGFCLGMVAGCGPKVFLHESDFNEARHLIPEAVEHGEPVAGAALTPSVPTPATVDVADRPPRHITLQEAIAIALDTGSSAVNTGFGAGSTPGTGLADDRLNNFNGSTTNGQTDKLRVLALNPAIANAVLEQSLARYDAVFTTSMNWTVTDNLAQGLSSFSNGQDAQFNSSIVKAFSSGGTASVGISNDYRILTSRRPVLAFSTRFTRRG